VINTAARIFTRTKEFGHITPVLASLHWLPVKARADFKVPLLTYKALHGFAPTYLSDLVLPYIPTRTLRSQDAGLITVPRIFMEWSAYPCERHILNLNLQDFTEDSSLQWVI
jgi:hypothetical protein